MGFKPTVNLTEQIADHIGHEIITGRLEPQSRIQELKVAQGLGVSRGSVREALLILERRHLIEIIPRRGAVVNGLQPDQIASFSALFSRLLGMCLSSIIEKPAKHHTELLEAVTMMENAVKAADESTIERLIEARGYFLEGLLALVDDYFLRSVVHGLVPASQRLSFIVTRHPDFDPRDCVRYHQALYAAISNRDEPRINELVSAYARRESRMGLNSDTVCQDRIRRVS